MKVVPQGDIVERLRGYNPPDRTLDDQRYMATDVQEAADEIVRLRNERAAHDAFTARLLTFDAFRSANVARCLKWHPAGIQSWSPSDWLTAVTGELGELASLLKMRNRERDGLPGNKFSPTDKQIADELADVLTYLDLLAEALGVSLGRAAVEKFNEVSERVGFPDRISVEKRSAFERTYDENAARRGQYKEAT